MTKRDRIAIVVSVLGYLPLVIILDETVLNTKASFIIAGFIIACYWGYRFIKDDISFMGKSNDKTQ